MKKVLILAYAFPPYYPIGAQRPYRLSKYFPQFGWEPVVLTIKRPGKVPDGIEIINSHHSKGIVWSIKSKMRAHSQKQTSQISNMSQLNNSNSLTGRNSSIKFFKEIIYYPDEQKIKWFKFATKSAEEYFKRERVDLIISTSPPVTSHLIARKLKNKYKIPWIADLRDLWTQNHFYYKYSLIKFFEKRLELKTLSDADALVTVTPRFAEKLRMLHQNKEIFCITNGYDPDDYSNPAKLTDKFTITYTGALYGGKMDPSMLFEVVSTLIKEGKVNKDLIEIRFYSRNADWLTNKIKKYGLRGVVNYYGFIPRELVLEKQKESQLLLLLTDKDTEVDYYPAKVFEYFGARRPIISLGGNGGIVKELLEENNAGIFMNTCESIKKFLLEYYEEYIKFGKVRYNSSTKTNKNIENYTYEAIAERYSKILSDHVL